MFAYSNNGLSFRAVDPSYTAQAGEVLFSTYATPTQLAAAFSGYSAAVVATETPAQQAAAALSAGLVITSTSTSALNGTYSLTANSISNINAVTTFILLNNSFPGNSSSMTWYDKSGGAHTFPNVTTFKNFASAFASYVAAVQLFADSNGNIGPLPSNQVTIA